MKKIILLFIVVFAMFSCSKNDENAISGIDPNKILLKKAISKDNTTSYVYDGYKLIRINSGEVYLTNNYTGNFITSGGEYYTKSNDKKAEIFYEYNSNNRLISSKSLLYELLIASKTLFNYNADGTVSYQNYDGDFTNQNTPSGSGKIWLDKNGQTIKSEQYDNDGKLVFRSEYAYDDKNYVFKNVIGFDKLFTPVGKINNLITTKTYDGNEIIKSTISYKILYNEYNFPKSNQTIFDDGFSRAEVQYYYE